MIFLNVPTADKNEVKQMGAKWNVTHKCWCIEENLSPFPFYKWLSKKDKLLVTRHHLNFLKYHNNI